MHLYEWDRKDPLFLHTHCSLGWDTFFFFFQLKDPLSQRYEVKLPTGVPRSKANNQSVLYTTEYQPEPFGFIVRRKSNGRVMWVPLFRCWAVHYIGDIIVIVLTLFIDFYSVILPHDIHFYVCKHNSAQMISLSLCIMQCLHVSFLCLTCPVWIPQLLLCCLLTNTFSCPPH